MSRKPTRIPGREAWAAKGFWQAHRWLVLRRSAQAFFLAIFLVGPLTGFWLVKGSIAGSLTLDFLPLTDPFIFAQAMFAGQVFGTSALVGVVLVVLAYAALGGRSYCAWVCPVNPLTDFAHWLRQKAGLPGQGLKLSRKARYLAVPAILGVSVLTGSVVWELINPVTLLHRGLVFGGLFTGLGWAVLLAVFLFDLAVTNRGWCGHLCPVGGAYGLIGHKSLIRVSAFQRSACDNCQDCLQVCPDPHVLALPLHGAPKGEGPVVLSPDCTNCGRCIDVCPQDVFRFTSRFNAAETFVEPAEAEKGQKAA